jgi:hypothetical protein
MIALRPVGSAASGTAATSVGGKMDMSMAGGFVGMGGIGSMMGGGMGMRGGMMGMMGMGGMGMGGMGMGGMAGNKLMGFNGARGI